MLDDDRIVTPPDDPKAPHVVAKSIYDQVIDGLKGASLVTVVAYAIVFGFEEGFNAFFQVPADYVATSLLSVFHVLSLVVFTLKADPWLAGLEIGVGAALWFIPSRVYGRHPMKLAVATLLLYCLSTVFMPVVLLAAALGVCLYLYRRTDESDPQRTRLLSRIGDDATKCVFVFLLVLTPLYYFGFHFAETESPRLAFDDKDGTTWVIARVLNGNFVAVGLMNGHDRQPAGCSYQFDVGSRPQKLLPTLRIVNETAENATWRAFGTLNYCVFGRDGTSPPNPLVASVLPYLLIGHGPATPDAAPR